MSLVLFAIAMALTCVDYEIGMLICRIDMTIVAYGMFLSEFFNKK